LPAQIQNGLQSRFTVGRFAKSSYMPMPMNLYEHILKPVETVLENYPEILFAVVFGSAAKNRLTPLSDIDIAVAAEYPLSYQQKTALILSLSKALSREIDLIDLQTVSGLVLQQALCTGVAVKKHSTALYAGLIKKMWYNQADMMPYTMRIIKKRCQDFVNG
jgi:uncharacterized protein